MPKIDIYTWSDIDDICRRLARQISTPYNAIVCVLRGGAIPGVILANELDIDLVLGLKIEQKGQSSLTAQDGASLYEGQRGVMSVPLNDMELAGKRVLIVDDVLDSGESLLLAREIVESRGPAKVAIATMQIKSYSKFRPEYYIEEKTNWLFYPWMSQRELADMKRRVERSD